MKQTIEEKLNYYLSMADKQVGPKPIPDPPGKPDSLSTVIRTKREADLFMAQLNAVAKLAREEYLESKQKDLENS